MNTLTLPFVDSEGYSGFVGYAQSRIVGFVTFVFDTEVKSEVLVHREDLHANEFGAQIRDRFNPPKEVRHPLPKEWKGQVSWSADHQSSGGQWVSVEAATWAVFYRDWISEHITDVRIATQEEKEEAQAFFLQFG